MLTEGSISRGSGNDKLNINRTSRDSSCLPITYIGTAVTLTKGRVSQGSEKGLYAFPVIQPCNFTSGDPSCLGMTKSLMSLPILNVYKMLGTRNDAHFDVIPLSVNANFLHLELQDFISRIVRFIQMNFFSPKLIVRSQ
jgi:hypothetical protein